MDTRRRMPAPSPRDPSERPRTRTIDDELRAWGAINGVVAVEDLCAGQYALTITERGLDITVIVTEEYPRYLAALRVTPHHEPDEHAKVYRASDGPVWPVGSIEEVMPALNGLLAYARLNYRREQFGTPDLEQG